jgi:enterochelin esterase-like enzyme
MKAIAILLIIGISLIFHPLRSQAQGTISDYHFFSKALNRDMACRVYLPQAYKPGNPEVTFPIIYFLHGASLGYESYDPLFTIVDNMITFKLIKPVIIILPDGLAPPYNGSFYTNSSLYGNFEDFISHDLISFADSAFHSKSERSKRAIMGASMGAYGAMKIALKHLHLFVGVASHSGPMDIRMMENFIPDLIEEDGGSAPFHWSPGSGKPLTNLTFTMAGAFSPNLDNEFFVDFPLDSLAKTIPGVMERWKEENICDIVQTNNPGNELGITFDCGIADEYYLYFQNRSLADTLTKYNIPYKYEEYLGNHTSGLPIRVTLSLAYMDYLFRSTDTEQPLMLTESKWKVWPNPVSNTLKIGNDQPKNQHGEITFRIFDPLGKVVLERNLQDETNELSIAHLPAGVYFFQIQDGRVIQNSKLLISR